MLVAGLANPTNSIVWKGNTTAMSIYTCQICQKECKNLANHLILKHKITNTEEYYKQHILIDKNISCPCCYINSRKFINFIKGYSKTCSQTCAIHYQWSILDDGSRKELNRIRLKNNKYSKGRPKGSKNINPYPMTEKVIEKLKNNPPPNWLGKKKSDETKEKHRISRNKYFDNGGKVTAPRKGIFKPANPQKYKGNSSNIIYRSSWEFKFMMAIDNSPEVIEWQSEEFCIGYISPITNKPRRYFPDFLIKRKEPNGNIITTLIEIKPKSQSIPPSKPKKQTKGYVKQVTEFVTNQAKWEAAKKYCSEKGWKFKVLNEDDLGINYKHYKKKSK